MIWCGSQVAWSETRAPATRRGGSCRPSWFDSLYRAQRDVPARETITRTAGPGDGPCHRLAAAAARAPASNGRFGCSWRGGSYMTGFAVGAGLVLPPAAQRSAAAQREAPPNSDGSEGHRAGSDLRAQLARAVANEYKKLKKSQPEGSHFPDLPVARAGILRRDRQFK